MFSDMFSRMELLEKQEVSEDQKTWSFTVKENLVWSDGEPLTSDDFIFTLELMRLIAQVMITSLLRKSICWKLLIIPCLNF